MSSAKRTPRYVDVIRPFEVTDGGQSPEVIRLRPELVRPTLPPITEAWPRAKAVPVSRRPWQLLLVPPTPGAPTRSFNVAQWQARAVLAAACAVLIVACAGTTAFVVALRSPGLFATSTETSLLRSRLAIVEDSLALARVAMEESADSIAAAAGTATSAVALVPGAPAGAASAASATRSGIHVAAPITKVTPRRPLARPAVVDDDAPSIGGGPFEGLPVIGAIASGFSRARRHPLLHIIRPHLGVDVAARRGTKIIAPAAGRVVFVGRKFGFGLVLEIQHSNGVTTRYAHCGSALVAEGAHVTRGTAIATVGSSGLSTGPHLHYEVLVHGHQVDPLRFRMPQMADSAAAPVVAAPAAQGPAGSAPVVSAPSAAPAPLVAPGTGGLDADAPK